MSKLFAFNVSNSAQDVDIKGAYNAHLQLWSGDTEASAGPGLECADSSSACEQIRRAYRDLYGCSVWLACAPFPLGKSCFGYVCPD